MAVVALVASLNGVGAVVMPAWARPVMTASDLQHAPNVTGLLAGLRTEEGQLEGLGAYRMASGYVRRARSEALSAELAARAAGTALRLARSRLARAVRADDVARAEVVTYKLALYQLAMAEYTQTVGLPSGVDFASLQTRLEGGEIADVTRVDALASLSEAHEHFKLTQVMVVKAKEVAQLAQAADLRAQKRLVAANLDLAASVRLLQKARLSATVPGAAPAHPGQQLSVLESSVSLYPGQLRPPTRRHAMALRLRPVSFSASEARRQVTEAPLAAGPLGTSALAGGPSILGPSLLSASQIEQWYESTGFVPNTTVAFPRLVDDYFIASRLTHVRADLAFAQSVVETGYFRFPPGGQLGPGDNNFAGIGACDSCSHGWSFPSALAGVLSQEELLVAYASPRPSARFSWVSNLGVEGCCSTWLGLSGIWASNLNYGYEILSVYKQMVGWVLRQQLQAAGLAPAQPGLRPLGTYGFKPPGICEQVPSRSHRT
ncbi:MAG: glucosaminidase domain-containing protein [Acidimicrobiales bacterium]